jgi:hypothetical protein
VKEMNLTKLLIGIAVKSCKMRMKFSNYRKSVFYFTVVLSCIFLLQGCTRKLAFTTSSVVPAAEGSVKIKKGKNNNYKIELNVIRLADPKRLNPPKDTYVVWMKTERNGIKNIGQLKTSSSLFSKTLKSSLETVTAFQPANFLVTAENNANIQQPSLQVVLKTESF